MTEVTWKADYAKGKMLNINYSWYLDYTSYLRPKRSLALEEVDGAVLWLAYIIEQDARSFLAGTQHRGMMEKSTAMVIESWPAHLARDILSAYQPGTEVQKMLNRALKLLKEALDKGLEIFEYNRPGYDEVTHHYRELLFFSTEKQEFPAN